MTPLVIALVKKHMIAPKSIGMYSYTFLYIVRHCYTLLDIAICCGVLEQA